MRATQPSLETLPPRPRWSWRREGVRIGGSVLVLTLLLVFLPFDRLLAAFGRVAWWMWVVALPGYLSLHLLGAAKWRLLVNAGGAGLSFRNAVRCYYAGLFGSTFLPSIVGGDFVRGGLALRLGKSSSGVVLGSVLDRSLDVLALAMVAGGGALLVPRSLDPASRRVFLALAALLAGVALIAVAVAAALPARRLPFRLRRVLVRLRRTARLLVRQPRYALIALAAGALLQALLALGNAWLGVAVGIAVPLQVWLFVWPMAKISALVPLTQGGIGVREAALAALFAPFGVPAVLAVAAGLAFQGVVIGGGLVAGGISFLLGSSHSHRTTSEDLWRG